MRRLMIVLLTATVAVCAVFAVGAWAANITGTQGPDVLMGGPSSDQIFGLAGPDSVRGGAGDDRIDGGESPDSLKGEEGLDEVLGGPGPDSLDLGPGADLGDPGLGSDSVAGGSGNDTILAGNGNVSSSGDDDNDVVFLGQGGGSASGGAGDDLLIVRGHSSHASAAGGAGVDACYVGPTTAASCEQVVRATTSTAAPSVSTTSGPADGATVYGSSVSYGVASSNAVAVLCQPDTGAIRPCTATFTMSGLAVGAHWVTLVAIPAGNVAPSVLRRRVIVAAPPTPTITASTSPAADTLRVAGTNLAAVDTIRARTADGQTLSYGLTDVRVSMTSSGGTDELRVTDLTLGAERIVGVDLVRAGQIVTTQTVSVDIASSITMQSASSPSPSTVAVSGTNLDAVSELRFVYDGGVLVVPVPGPGVTVGANQIIVTAAALDGVHLSSIDSIILVSGPETVATLQVDLVVTPSADNVPPAVTVPSDLLIEAATADGSPAAYAASAHDAVDGAVAVSCNHASGDVFALGDTLVTCSAQDHAGNEGTGTFRIRVVDTVGPTITVPPSIDVEPDAATNSGGHVEFEVSAMDVISGAASTSCTYSSGDYFLAGTTSVQCEAIDARGNRGARAFTVTVRDHVSPQLHVLGTGVIEAYDEAGAPAVIPVEALDAVDGRIQADCDPSSGTPLTIGTHRIHCEAVDGSGNLGTLDAVVRVVLVDATATAQGPLQATSLNC